MTFVKRYANLIIAILVTVLMWGLLLVLFDFYYDLNDDVLIKDIISGIYTGSPNGHNNQMMYPISLLLAGLYRISNNISWFGLFEIACFICSFIIIVTRLMVYYPSGIKKLVLTIGMAILFLGLYLWELVMLQYTVVCGILCAAASVWVLTTPIQTCFKKFLASNIAPIVLAIIAFNIRSEMFLLMCPFMAAAGLIRWIQEPTAKENKALSDDSEQNSYKGILDISNIKKYLGFIVIIVIGILITIGADRIAYSSDEWKEFRRFFDARTDVYDFTGIPDYEANESFYIENSISRDQYDRLLDYNFDLDKTITADTLETIAAYVKSGRALNADGSPYNRLNKSLKTTIGEYIRGILSIKSGDANSYDSPFQDEVSQLTPGNIIVIMLYIALVMLAISGINIRILIDIVILVILRSIAWIYIYYKGRLVPRITHPMLLIEILILITVIIIELCRQSAASKKSSGSEGFSKTFTGVRFTYLILALIVIICIANALMTGREISRKQAIRDDINYSAMKLNEYTSSRDGYYLVDVYSTVSFTEPVFGWDIYSKCNQQLAGGWIARSPLDSAKSAEYDKIYFAYDNGSKWIYEELN